MIFWANKIFNRDLEKKLNRFRWYEYALSSSLVIILIAMLFAVYDIGSFILMFFLNAIINLFGLVMEEMSDYKKKTDWKSFVFGSIAGFVPWVIILLYAFGNASLSKVSWFVYALAGSYFVFFNLFPINKILQYKKVGPWKNYLYG